MIKNVYFHIDEIGRDAITASALKKGFAERGINLIYGNRVYTKRVLEKFVFAFDVIILPRPMFLNDFKNINKALPTIVILFTESVGRVVDKNNDKFTLFSLLDKPFMEGNKTYLEKVTSFCLWGKSGKTRIDKYYPEIANKFHVVGHPRHDKKCIHSKNINNTKGKAKIGLITRQPMLNDFAKRQPVESIVTRSSTLEECYDYNNSTTGDFLLSQDNEPVDEIYIEAIDIKILLEILLRLKEKGHEIHLKVHPREDKELWTNLKKKYNLNVIIADWKSPFSHWIKDLDYVIGPASTSFYDCCVAGIQPICTRKIYKDREIHINKFSEEYGALMEHIVTPSSIDDIIKIVSKKNKKFELSDKIKQILLDETNYPHSNNSIDEIIEVCIASKKEDYVNNFMKNIYMISFNIYGSIVNNVMRFYRIVKGRKEQGSTFLMSRKNVNYIDNLVD